MVYNKKLKEVCSTYFVNMGMLYPRGKIVRIIKKASDKPLVNVSQFMYYWIPSKEDPKKLEPFYLPAKVSNRELMENISKALHTAGCNTLIDLFKIDNKGNVNGYNNADRLITDIKINELLLTFGDMAKVLEDLKCNYPDILDNIVTIHRLNSLKKPQWTDEDPMRLIERYFLLPDGSIRNMTLQEAEELASKFRYSIIGDKSNPNSLLTISPKKYEGLSYVNEFIRSMIIIRNRIVKKDLKNGRNHKYRDITNHLKHYIEDLTKKAYPYISRAEDIELGDKPAFNSMAFISGNEIFLFELLSCMWEGIEYIRLVIVGQKEKIVNKGWSKILDRLYRRAGKKLAENNRRMREKIAKKRGEVPAEVWEEEKKAAREKAEARYEQKRKDGEII